MSACDSASLIQISHKSAKMAPRYNQLPIFNMASDFHHESKISTVHQMTILAMEIHIYVPNLMEI